MKLKLDNLPKKVSQWISVQYIRVKRAFPVPRAHWSVNFQWNAIVSFLHVYRSYTHTCTWNFIDMSFWTKKKSFENLNSIALDQIYRAKHIKTAVFAIFKHEIWRASHLLCWEAHEIHVACLQTLKTWNLFLYPWIKVMIWGNNVNFKKWHFFL